MLRRVPLGVGTKEVEASVERLEDEGVPLQAITPLMEALELLAIVSALQYAGGTSGSLNAGDEAAAGPAARRAQRARGLSSDELFETLCTSIVTAVETAIHLKRAKECVPPRSQPAAS
jgi:hypothetical protein